MVCACIMCKCVCECTVWYMLMYVQVCASIIMCMCGCGRAGVCACMCGMGPYSMIHRKNKPESSGKFLWEHVGKEGGAEKLKGTSKATFLYSFWVETFN